MSTLGKCFCIVDLSYLYRELSRFEIQDASAQNFVCGMPEYEGSGQRTGPP